MVTGASFEALVGEGGGLILVACAFFYEATERAVGAGTEMRMRLQSVAGGRRSRRKAERQGHSHPIHRTPSEARGSSFVKSRWEPTTSSISSTEGVYI